MLKEKKIIIGWNEVTTEMKRLREEGEIIKSMKSNGFKLGGFSQPTGISLHAPKEVLTNPVLYYDWCVEKHAKFIRYGLGKEDVEYAKNGWDFSFPTRRATAKGVLRVFPLSQDFKAPFTTRLMINFVKANGLHDKEVFDESGVYHSLGVFAAGGLLYRIPMPGKKEYLYYFEDKIIELGPTWWFIGNTRILGNPVAHKGLLKQEWIEENLL